MSNTNNAAAVIVANFNHATDEQRIRCTFPGARIVACVDEIGAPAFAVTCDGMPAGKALGIDDTAAGAWSAAYEIHFSEVWNRIRDGAYIRELPA